jgi:hypothetical protein
VSDVVTIVIVCIALGFLLFLPPGAINVS